MLPAPGMGFIENAPGRKMKLYLVQHGEAKSEKEDPDRSLTDRGTAEIRAVAEAAKRAGLKPAQIYHSGKTRAQQTADILADALGCPCGRGGRP